MERFKINPIPKNPSQIYRHNRRKSDQIYSKDVINSINPQISSTRLQNASKAFYRSSILIKNPSIRSHSNDIKKKISIDLSKIRISKNPANMNFSARNSEYHNQFSNICLRKKEFEKSSTSNPCTERLGCKLNEKNKENEELKIILEPSPEIEVNFPNKFMEKMKIFEEKLTNFYLAKAV